MELGYKVQYYYSIHGNLSVKEVERQLQRETEDDRIIIKVVPVTQYL